MINLNINGNIKTYAVENDEQGIKLSDVARDVEQEYSGYISLAVVMNITLLKSTGNSI